MCNKVLAGIFIIIALLLALLVSFWPQQMATAIHVTRFFDIMLPVLAVGALIKYLCSCTNK